MVEILYSVFDYQKIKETWVWSLNTQYLFTTVYCKPPLCKVHKENCNLYFLQTFVRLGNAAIRLSVITVWHSISCNINWQSRSPIPCFKNNLNLPVTRQFIDSYPNGRSYDHHECTICLAWGLYAQANISHATHSLPTEFKVQRQKRD